MDLEPAAPAPPGPSPLARGAAPLHVVLGAGQIGAQVAALLGARGLPVRLVRRSPRPGAGPDTLAGDAADPAFAARAVAGAATVYLCLNAPYHRWEADLPPLWSSVRRAAAGAGARLVVLDNLYMLGRCQGPRREDSPRAPCSGKGRLRARLEAELLGAMAAGELEVATGRASDFFGPGVEGSRLFHPRNLARLRAGRSAELLGGDPDQPHAWSYAPDVAAGLVTLGTAPGPVGGVWHLPVAFQGSTRELVRRLGAALGRPLEVSVIPGVVAALLGLLSPLVRASREQTYELEAPFLVDDSRFCAAFGAAPTPVDAALAATARWVADRPAVSG